MPPGLTQAPEPGKKGCKLCPGAYKDLMKGWCKKFEGGSFGWKSKVLIPFLIFDSDQRSFSPPVPSFPQIHPIEILRLIFCSKYFKYHITLPLELTEMPSTLGQGMKAISLGHIRFLLNLKFYYPF